MSEEREPKDWNGVSRREALRWLLSTPVHLGLLSSTVAAQVAAPKNLRMLPFAPGANVHPRMLLTPSTVTALRAKLGSNSAFRSRWQAAINQFQGHTNWTASSGNGLSAAFGAFLCAIREPAHDHGLTFTMTRAQMVAHVITKMYAVNRSQPKEVAGLALAYDCIFNDLSPARQSEVHGWLETAFNNSSISAYLGINKEVWLYGDTVEHWCKTFCGLATDDYQSRLTEAYQRAMQIVDSNEWMAMAFGIGREMHGGVFHRHGIPLLLHVIKNASNGAYTDADTFDRFTTYLRDVAPLMRQATIPHPSIPSSPGTYWLNEKFHRQDPTTVFHTKANTASTLVWAMALLPGRLSLGSSGMADQPNLAPSDAAYLGYLSYLWTQSISGSTTLKARLNYANIGSGSDQIEMFTAVLGWLLYNAPEPTPIAPAAAGIPLVRRWWPGTLDWTFIKSSHDPTAGSFITYTHRRYGVSEFEEGCRQNGKWTAHRDGPLLVQRGSASKSTPNGSATWGSNGCVGFVDPDLYPLFTTVNTDDFDAGGQRNVGDSPVDKAEVLASPVCDHGQVLKWHADAQVVCITSDLTRSYNSDAVQTGTLAGNEPKISSFIREFVTIRRGADGTDREKVFTYDRIVLKDTKFQARYSLCPATNPDIDGTESAPTPWGPDEADPNFTWYAVGPTRWRSAGATRLIYSNQSEPSASTPGNGKVCVTWLRPLGAAATVEKRGGNNARTKTTETLMNGDPNFGPWVGWYPKEDWGGQSSSTRRAYNGLYTVDVWPTTAALDTRLVFAAELMAVADTPSTAAELTCDANTVAVRCGATAVVFKKETGTRTAGSVGVPSGVKLVALTNLPANQVRTLVGSGGLTITTPERQSSNTGVLAVEVSGSGTLTFS